MIIVRGMRPAEILAGNLKSELHCEFLLSALETSLWMLYYAHEEFELPFRWFLETHFPPRVLYSCSHAVCITYSTSAVAASSHGVKHFCAVAFL